MVCKTSVGRNEHTFDSVLFYLFDVSSRNHRNDKIGRKLLDQLWQVFADLSIACREPASLVRIGTSTVQKGATQPHGKLDLDLIRVPIGPVDQTFTQRPRGAVTSVDDPNRAAGCRFGEWQTSRYGGARQFVAGRCTGGARGSRWARPSVARKSRQHRREPMSD